MSRSLTVADCTRQGNGRYSFGRSLYLIVKGGSALWEKQFRVGGKLRTKCYGSAVGAMPVSLTKARELDARDWLERKAGRQVASNSKYHNGTHGNGNGNGVLFAAARERYLEDHAAEWSEGHRDSLRRMLLRHTAPLDNKSVSTITADDIIPILIPIWKGPNSTTGNRVRMMIEHIISSTGRIADNPAKWATLQYRMAKKVQSYEPKSRDMMQPADVPAFMATLAKDKSVQSRALQFMILTAARQDEALEATAGEFDMAAKTWTVPKERMKMKREHIVPLSDAAIKLLGTMHGGLVFPSKLGGRMSQQTTRDLLPAGVTVHGFRAALTTWAATQPKSKGYDKDVRDFSIAHYPTDPNDAAYNRADMLDQRRKMMEEWAAFVTTAH